MPPTPPRSLISPLILIQRCSSSSASSAPQNFPRTSTFAHHHQERKPSSFVDLKCINATSGKGGDGSIHFYKGLINPIGPPCGGNGGRGGDVWIVASREVTSLGGLMNRYKAQEGEFGQRQNMHGKDSPAVEIVVPIGTLVRQVDSMQDIALAKQMRIEEEEELKRVAIAEEEMLKRLDKEEYDAEVSTSPTQPVPEIEEYEPTDEELEELEHQQRIEQQERKAANAEKSLEFVRRHFIFRKDYIPHPDRIKLLRSRIPPRIPPQPPICLDLSTHGERHLIVRGGRGGFGNPHFSSNEIKGPGIASRGEPGQNFWLELELKTIADVGLVGLPNAGKSTLLKRITNAQPKIASYPFTTLNPYVGTITYPDSHTITVADIPGLVAGAHLNVGLGHEFLRHVERSDVLVYVVDLGGLDAGADFMILRDELERYKNGLTSKPSLVIANKADVGQVAKENLKGLKEAVEKCVGDGEAGILVVPVSAREDKNIGVALAHLRKLVDRARVKVDGSAGDEAVMSN
ncbi:hypothetical protein HDU98_003450 [Podochytrium sp. JEL0797]|nr:hypothetical protein HDU98_003450 [Podochytrium sp. JEL0797]